MQLRRLPVVIVLSLIFAIYLATTASAVISSCGFVNASDVLSGSISSTGTCLTLNASDVEINCLGFTITYDTGAGASSAGVAASSFDNITLRNCNIIDSTTGGSGSIGVFYSDVTGGAMVNNTIRANGTTGNIGIFVGSFSDFISITNNRINSQGSGTSNIGIEFLTVVTNSNITNNTIFANGSSASRGIFIEDFSEDNRVINNTVAANGTGPGNYGIWVSTVSINNTIVNNSITAGGTTDNYGVFIDDVVNTTSLINNTIIVNGTARGVGVFMTVFSPFNIVENNSVIIRDPLNASAIFINTVSNSNRIAGNRILATGVSGITGILVFDFSDFNNMTNNIINIPGPGFGISGILVANFSANNEVLNNNITLTSSAFSSGIFLELVSNNNSIYNNFVNISGTGSTNIGLVVSNFSDLNRVRNNSVIVTSNDSFSNGINVFLVSNNNTITNNSFFTSGTDSNFGMIASNGSEDNLFDSNIVSANGIGEFNFGVFVLGPSNNFTNNTIMTTGLDENKGFSITGGSDFSLVRNNTIVASGGDSDGIEVSFSSGVTIINNTITHTRFALHLLSALPTIINDSFLPEVDGSLFINETDGSINFTEDTSFFIETNFSMVVNISPNSIFVNSTDPAGNQINTTADLEFRGLTFADPRPIFDLDDDGTFVLCPMGRCTEISYNGSSYFYNVSSFTTYSSEETPTGVNVTKTALPSSVLPGGTLIYTITITAGNSTVSNITIVEGYPAGTVFVNSTIAPTSGNDTFDGGNLTAGNSTTLIIELTVGALSSGTVLTNLVNITFQQPNGTTVTENASASATVTIPPPSGGSGGGSGGGVGNSVCPQYCSDPKYASSVLVCKMYPCNQLQPAPQKQIAQSTSGIKPTPTPALQRIEQPEQAIPEEPLPAITKTEAAVQPVTSYKLMYTLFVIFALAAIAGFAAFAHMHHKKR